MQAELLAANPSTIIRILGVNSVGSEAGNPVMCTPGGATPNRIIPWLQDVVATDAWGLWGVIERDLVILDQGNFQASVYNLTVHDLSVPANYASLKALLKSVAGEP